jgi:tetratricopeptide (TPR) repeat protein
MGTAQQVMFHSMRGILAASNGDYAMLRHADRQLSTIAGVKARTAQRVLAAYELELRDAVQAAADSLYKETWGPPTNWGAINRLSASRWLLANGDTARASSLLSSCQWSIFPVQSWQEDLLLAGHCYLELARIEEARGRHRLAREYYWQFLKRYDSPVEAHRQLVEEARAAYERVGGDVGRLPALQPAREVAG